MNRQEFIKVKEQYLSGLPSMKKSLCTIRQYTNVLGQFEQNVDRNEEITPLTVAKWRANLFNDGIKHNTINTYLTVLYAFFNWAVRMKIITDSPITKEEIPEMQQREYDLLSGEEITTILKANNNNLSKMTLRNRAIVVLLLQTGLRNSELRALRLCDLDFEKNTITVTHGKGDKTRIVTFAPLSQELIKKYLNNGVRPSNLPPDAWLFGSNADNTGLHSHSAAWHQFSTTALLGIVNRYTKKICGHSVKVHNLRHAYASILAEQEVPMRDIQLSLGHANLELTEKIYTQVLNKRKSADTIYQTFQKMGC